MDPHPLDFHITDIGVSRQDQPPKDDEGENNDGPPTFLISIISIALLIVLLIFLMVFRRLFLARREARLGTRAGTASRPRTRSRTLPSPADPTRDRLIFAYFPTQAPAVVRMQRLAQTAGLSIQELSEVAPIVPFQTKDGGEEENTCAVCLEEMDSDSKTRRMPCGHDFDAK